MEFEKFRAKRCPFSNQQCTEYCILYVGKCVLLKMYRNTEEILYTLEALQQDRKEA